MAYHDRLDIALDPIGGHGGATTTCEALWMAVPVVTLEGDCVASRMTSSLLSAIGHPEWIAANEDDYISKVVILAQDIPKRRELRKTQRNRMAGSPLCDAESLARSLEEAYHAMIGRWFARNQ